MSAKSKSTCSRLLSLIHSTQQELFLTQQIIPLVIFIRHWSGTTEFHLNVCWTGLTEFNVRCDGRNIFRPLTSQLVFHQTSPIDDEQNGCWCDSTFPLHLPGSQCNVETKITHAAKIISRIRECFREQRLPFCIMHRRTDQYAKIKRYSFPVVDNDVDKT